ncbi:MAG: MFS transporter, partial [Firmicutes bacterium]|nr:MFS transporter [Bacillota bacterium]
AGTVPASKPVVGILQAVRNRAFFFISSAYFVCGFTGHVIGAHLVLWALDQGFSEMTAATALGLMGGTNALGILVMGAVSDRLGRKFPLGLVYLLRGLSFFLIFWARSESSLILFSLVFGFSTFATAPITSALVGDLFGARSVGRLYGAVTLFHQVGAGLGVYLAGLTFDLTGTYLWVFAASAIMLGFAAILSWTAPTGSGCFPVNLRSGLARPARPEGTGARPPA